MNQKSIRKSVLIGLVLVTGFLSGCKKSTYYQLTDEEMKWLVYKNYELLSFENSQGDELNFYVTIRLKAYDKSGETYSEFTSANIAQLNDTVALFTSDSYGQLFIHKGSDGFLVTLTWPHFPLKDVPLTSMTPVAATVGGINYPDVFILDGSGQTDLRFYNSKLWVSKSFGVVQIEDVYGNTWVRQF